MEQLNKIPSVIQIVLAEFLASVFLFPVVSKLYERLHPSVGYKGLPLETSDYVFFLVGVLLYLWLLKEIFLPRVKHDSWFSFKTGASPGGEYYFSNWEIEQCEKAGLDEMQTGCKAVFSAKVDLCSQ